MTLTIWGRKTSSNVQKVLWLCDELQIPWRRIDAGLEHGVNTTEEFLAKNPNGLVPLIEDDDFLLWESNSILRYLANKAGADTFYPVEPRRRADVDRWLDWQLSTLWPAMRPFYIGLTRVPEQDRDEQAIVAARDRTATLWSILEDRLQPGGFVAGSAPTLADMGLGSFIHRWFRLNDEAADRHPRLYELYQRLCDREPYRRHIVSQPF